MPTNFVPPRGDTLRAQAITSGWRQQYNEALWDWLTSSGYTQATLNDKIRAAELDGFDFTTFIVSLTVLDSAGNSFSPQATVLDSDGNSFVVSKTVLDSDGNSFTVA